MTIPLRWTIPSWSLKKAALYVLGAACFQPFRYPGWPGAPTSCQASGAASVFACWAEGTVPSVERLICAPVRLPFLTLVAVALLVGAGASFRTRDLQ